MTSLLKSELKAAGLGKAANTQQWMEADAWPEDLQMAGSGPRSLPCDSLDLLRLAAAVNEMFHLHEAHDELGLLSAGTFGDWLDSIERAWAAGGGRVTFMTSGSTGRPTPCTHDFSHLQAEIRYLAQVFADRTRMVPFTPAHHIYGFLFTAMLPDQLGCEAVAVADAGAGGPAQELRSGDLVVSFPDRWQWLDRTIAQWPKGVAGVVSTAPCPPDLLGSLIGRGLESITEVYGSSETAGIGLRRWPETRYRFMPFWTLETVDSEGTLLRHDSGLQVRLKDRLELHGDGSFTPTGRIDAAVQVGGMNVYPARIAALFREQPGVREVVVRLSKFEEGGRLKAYVVPETGSSPAELEGQLLLWMGDTFSAAEQPKSFTFGDALPKDQMGKDCDWHVV
ncbi:MAG: AMP-binding enzyme [Janthinobacterium lividum]